MNTIRDNETEKTKTYDNPFQNKTSNFTPCKNKFEPLKVCSQETLVEQFQ